MAGIDWGPQTATCLRALPTGCVLDVIRFLDEGDGCRIGQAARLFVFPQAGLGAARIARAVDGGHCVLAHRTLASFCARRGAVLIDLAYYGGVPDGDVGYPELWGASRGKDVTAEVRRCIQKGRLDIRQRLNGLFGDPCRGTPKRLVVLYCFQNDARPKILATPRRGGEKLYMTITPTKAVTGKF